VLQIILSTIGAVAGVGALGTIIWALAFRFSALSVKVDLMWKVVVEDALSRERDRGVLSHGSDYGVNSGWLCRKAEACDRSMVPIFAQIASRTSGQSRGDIALAILSEVGPEEVAEQARHYELNSSGYLAVTAVMVEEINQHGRPLHAGALEDARPHHSAQGAPDGPRGNVAGQGGGEGHPT